MRDAAHTLLDDLTRTLGGDGDATDLITARLDRLTAEHGWWPTCAVTLAAMAVGFTPDIVDSLPQVLDDDTRTLLRVAAVAAAHPEDRHAWTIPLAMLASLGETDARFTAACAVFCAGFGAIEEAGCDH